MNDAIKLAVSAGWNDKLYRHNSGNAEVWTHYDSLVLDALEFTARFRQPR